MPSFKGFIIGSGLARFTGHIMADRHLISKRVLIEKRVIGASLDAAAVVTFTPAQMLSGLILRDVGGVHRADKVPTAADLVQALGDQAFVGASFEFTLENQDGTHNTTPTTNSGDTLLGTMQVDALSSKRFLVVITNVTATTEAYTMYSLGLAVH